MTVSTVPKRKMPEVGKARVAQQQDGSIYYWMMNDAGCFKLAVVSRF